MSDDENLQSTHALARVDMDEPQLINT